MTLDTDIKLQIKSHLDALVGAHTLGAVIVDDFKIELQNRNIPAYPCAILTPSTIESVEQTNRDNRRTFAYDIVVLARGEDIAGSADVETLREAILDEFDNDPTLGGKAVSGCDPSASRPEMVTTADKAMVVFVVTIKAKGTKTLNF